MSTTTLLTAPPAIVGESSAIRRARASLEAPGPAPLLILADEGLEPEAIARYVHDRTRPGQPFLRVDCADANADAVETAIFGGRARASADLETLGPDAALVRVRRGTLFLEQIGELPASLQRRLARVLRDGEARVGGKDGVRPLTLEARVVASAPPSLPADARDGRFRGDLLRRFGAVPVSIPSLRQRPEDIESIAVRVATDLCEAAGRRRPEFTPAALTMLTALPWTHNVDDLRVTLERVFRNLSGDRVRQEDLLPDVPVDGIVRRMNGGVSLREARRRFEREYIASVLEQHGWRMSEAARTLGIERANLYRKTRELGIQRSAPGVRH